ncbi:hypothetical protein FC304_13760, partial [Listeria monocytogenes]|nr:hypothetical protein [Listeria monocytogenes]
ELQSFQAHENSWATRFLLNQTDFHYFFRQFPIDTNLTSKRGKKAAYEHRASYAASNFYL